MHCQLSSVLKPKKIYFTMTGVLSVNVDIVGEIYLCRPDEYLRLHKQLIAWCSHLGVELDADKFHCPTPYQHF